MKYLLKALVSVYIVFMFLNQSSALIPLGLVSLLLVLGVHVFRHRLYDSTYLLGTEFLLTTLLIAFGAPLGLWYVALGFDMAYRRQYIGLVPIGAVVYVFDLYADNPMLLLVVAVSVLLATACSELEQQNQKNQHSLDQERRLRYSLEDTKQLLLRSQQEIEHITEIQERNRIAREIHDHVGHNIAGILMQLQVAEKCLGQDETKARTALTKSITKLAESLETLRDTVHNLRPVEKLGLEYVRAIIDDYSFCPVEFCPRGDFGSIPPRYLEAISGVVKEALTNTAKYSKASKVYLELEANERFLRLCIRDNGIGCSKIREGLGLSGMRERIANLGGTITIGGENGFMIVCVLYR